MEWCSRWISGQLKLHGGTLSGKKEKEKSKTIRGQPGLQSEFQGYTEEPCLRKPEKKKKKAKQIYQLYLIISVFVLFFWGKVSFSM